MDVSLFSAFGVSAQYSGGEVFSFQTSLLGFGSTASRLACLSCTGNHHLDRYLGLFTIFAWYFECTCL